ncbi:MAG: cytochrome c biogenesis protein ResB [Myxococcales bacterium]
MSEATAPGSPSESSVSEIARLPELTRAEAHLAIEQVWRFFCSLRLTLVNLLLLFFGMIAGTFVNPQNDSLSNIEKAFANRPGVLWAYRTFELYDLFHSWWFTLFLTSLALNLIACSLERLPRIYFLVRYPEKRLDRTAGLRFKAPARPAAATADEVAQALRKRGYAAQVAERPAAEGGGADVFAERGRYARFGVWVVHLSLLLILGGGIFGRLTAFEGTADVPQGGGEADAFIVRKPDGSALRRKLVDEGGAPFLVRCDDFRLKEFEPGKPKSFESDLRLFARQRDGSAGKLLAKETITVNHPLRYGGLTFYQASYRQLDEQMRAKVALVDKATGERRELLVAPGEPVDAADGLRYQLVDYQADFAGLGPAVQVVRAEEKPSGVPRDPDAPLRAPAPEKQEKPPAPSKDAKVTSFWVFAKAPDFDRDNRDDRFAFTFDRLAPIYATGLQIARDPSTPVVYAGCFLLFAGIGIAFYSSHKRIWARLVQGRLALGGAAHRNVEAFAGEFAAICDELVLPRASVASAGQPPAGAERASA